MGINGLNTFLKEKTPESIREVHLCEFADSKVAIDTSIYFYKFLYRNDRYIEGFFQQIYKLMNNNILPIYIFDGIPPPEKKEIIDQRKEKKILLNKTIKELETKINHTKQNIGNKNQIELQSYKEDIENLEKLKKKNIYVTKEHYTKLKDFLDLLGIPYLQCDEEADLLCNTLVLKNKVDLILSDDMDILVGGAKKILRNFNSNSNKIFYYNLDDIQRDLKLTNEQWLNLCVLSGCDYCPRIHGVGVKNAYKFIQNYPIEQIFKILEYKAPSDYISRFNRSKELFTKIIDTEEINNLEIKKKPCNNEVVEFLKELTNLSEKQISNRLKIINKL
jgi:flap endonuclease-1